MEITPCAYLKKINLSPDKLMRLNAFCMKIGAELRKYIILSWHLSTHPELIMAKTSICFFFLNYEILVKPAWLRALIQLCMKGYFDYNPKQYFLGRLRQQDGPYI